MIHANYRNPFCGLLWSPENWNFVLLVSMGNNAITNLKTHKAYECCAEAKSGSSFTKHNSTIFHAPSIATTDKHAD
jgi:hypothetical protein